MNESVPDYSLTGMPIEVSSPIQLNAGWNWIGYYPQVQIDITPALATIQDNANQIKNQTESATWYGVWIGNLTQMKPGIGYKLLMNADDELIYPEEKGIVSASYNSDNIMNWKVISGTQYNMVVIAKVMLNEDVITNGVLGAFDKQGNCRSVGKLKNDFWYFTIVSNIEGEEIGFKLYDSITGRVYSSNETLAFADNITLGTSDEPMIITMKDGVDNNLPTVYRLEQNYPNPFNPITNIDYQLSQATNVEIVVYNIKGEIVRTLVNEKKSAGYHTVIWNGKDNRNANVSSGIYFYKLSANNNNIIRKMLLMK